MKLFVAGLSYKTAPVEVREKLAVSSSKSLCSACRIKIGANLAEIVVLSTCNRVEIYGATEQIPDSDQLFQWLNPTGLHLTPYLYFHEGQNAARHLFSVASGLDSMVLGETEITGQVKQAYQNACKAKQTGKILNRVFQGAMQTAKEIRTRTEIGRGATSVGSAAVELTERIFGPDLTGKTIMILGAGKMGEACVKHLARKGNRTVLVVNRSHERAEALAAEFGGRAVHFEHCLTAMTEADVVVSSTGCPGTVLSRHDIESVMRARHNRQLVLVDIAVPRDIEPIVQSLAGVYLYNIDDLEALVRENVLGRENAARQCRAIIEERSAALIAKLAAKPHYHREKTHPYLPDWSFGRPLAYAA